MDDSNSEPKTVASPDASSPGINWRDAVIVAAIITALGGIAAAFIISGRDWWPADASHQQPSTPESSTADHPLKPQDAEVPMEAARTVAMSPSAGPYKDYEFDIGANANSLLLVRNGTVKVDLIPSGSPSLVKIGIRTQSTKQFIRIMDVKPGRDVADTVGLTAMEEEATVFEMEEITGGVLFRVTENAIFDGWYLVPEDPEHPPEDRRGNGHFYRQINTLNVRKDNPTLPSFAWTITPTLIRVSQGHRDEG